MLLRALDTCQAESGNLVGSGTGQILIQLQWWTCDQQIKHVLLQNAGTWMYYYKIIMHRAFGKHILYS